MPPQSVAQRINGGLLRSFDASQRTPPQHVAQRINSRLSETGGGDASQRCPAWGAAAAAAAATRAAAASCAKPSQEAVNGTMSPLSAVDAAVLAQVALAAADAVTLAHQVSPTAASAAAPSVPEDASPLKQEPRASAGCAEVYPTDSLKCWLAGISENCTPSDEDLVERLRAAMPETYDD